MDITEIEGVGTGPLVSFNWIEENSYPVILYGGADIYDINTGINTLVGFYQTEEISPRRHRDTERKMQSKTFKITNKTLICPYTHGLG